MSKTVIHRDPDIQGGVPVFAGTRVPLKSLFDCFEAADSLDQFLADYPSVSREQAVTALELEREAASGKSTSKLAAKRQRAQRTPGLLFF